MTDYTDLIRELRHWNPVTFPLTGRAADALEAQGRRLAEVVSVNTHLAALVTDGQEELRKCQQDAIQLQAQLAEAEALLREARRKIRDIDGMNASQFVDEGIGLSGFNLLAGIDAFLAPKEKERE